MVMVRVRVTYFRVTRELQTRCKRRAYASCSGGVRMYTSHTRHMRVTTYARSSILGCGGCANIRVIRVRVRVRVTYFRVADPTGDRLVLCYRSLLLLLLCYGNLLLLCSYVITLKHCSPLNVRVL